MGHTLQANGTSGSAPWEVIGVLQLCRNVEHLDGYGNFPVPIIGMTEEVSKFLSQRRFLGQPSSRRTSLK